MDGGVKESQLRFECWFFFFCYDLSAVEFFHCDLNTVGFFCYYLLNTVGIYSYDLNTVELFLRLALDHGNNNYTCVF